MAGRGRISLNRNAFRQIAKSGEVLDELTRRGERVANAARDAAPEGQEVDVSPYQGANRARVSVIAPAGLDSDREDGWLSRAADAARG